jgi:formate-nitrite transporter family protein
MVIWVLTFLVGIGHFAHCIASSGEILSAVLSNQTSFTHYLGLLPPAVGGNIAGGVMLVTLLEYGQVHSRGA